MNLAESAPSETDEQPFHSTPIKNKDIRTKELKVDSTNYENESFEPLSESDSDEDSNATGDKTSTGEPSSFQFSERSFKNISPTAENNQSAWEKWMIQKERERRENIIEEMSLQMKKNLNLKTVEKERAHKEQLANATYQKWLRKKNEERKKKREDEKKQEELLMNTKEAAKKQILELSKIKYDTWKTEKDKDKKEKDNQKVELSREENKRFSGQSYKDWLKKTSCRPRRECYSYGYAGGILVGYYDATSPPPPSFYNPHPWVSSPDSSLVSKLQDPDLPR